MSIRLAVSSPRQVTKPRSRAYSSAARKHRNPCRMVTSPCRGSCFPNGCGHALARKLETMTKVGAGRTARIITSSGVALTALAAGHHSPAPAFVSRHRLPARPCRPQPRAARIHRQPAHGTPACTPRLLRRTSVDHDDDVAVAAGAERRIESRRWQDGIRHYLYRRSDCRCSGWLQPSSVDYFYTLHQFVPTSLLIPFKY